jgi:cell division protein FtsA
MYSTCIGLILRGYHDFENGRLRFAGERGNYIHMHEDEVEDIVEAKPAAPTLPVEPGLEEEAAEQRNNRRNEKVKKLFDGLKGKFMKMFEDVEDQEIR